MVQKYQKVVHKITIFFYISAPFGAEIVTPKKNGIMCCKYLGVGFRARPIFFHSQQYQLNSCNLLTTFKCGLLDCNAEMYFCFQLQQYHVVPPIIYFLHC
jgi:hypothetical protein